MAYLLDTCIFRELLDHLPKKGSLFSSVWEKLEKGFQSGTIVSVDECYNELSRHFDVESENMKWIEKHKICFLFPTNEESLFIRELFKNKKFQEAIHTKNILENKPAADVYLIAKAQSTKSTIVTNEKYKSNSAQIPNICELYSLQCIDYDTFMENVMAKEDENF